MDPYRVMGVQVYTQILRHTKCINRYMYQWCCSLSKIVMWHQSKFRILCLCSISSLNFARKSMILLAMGKKFFFLLWDRSFGSFFAMWILIRLAKGNLNTHVQKPRSITALGPSWEACRAPDSYIYPSGNKVRIERVISKHLTNILFQCTLFSLFWISLVRKRDTVAFMSSVLLGLRPRRGMPLTTTNVLCCI
jgi:hypothetical protein